MKQISKKKSQHQFSTKQIIQNELITMKKKKSASNLIPNNKIKKQDKQKQKQQIIYLNNITKKNKQQNKLVHSHSKGKLNKKNQKSEKNQKTDRINKNNDENINNLNNNHKKSTEKIKQSTKIFFKQIKQTKQGKVKITNDKLFHTEKEQKVYNTQKNGLVRTKSLSKINPSKNTQSKVILKKIQKKNSTIDIHSKFQPKKSISTKLETVKKQFAKNKFKKSTTSSTVNLNPQKRPKIKAKRISQIIQKSILYSQVNFDFKQQISFLVGSDIKEKQQFFVPFHFNSQNSQNLSKQNIQKRIKQYKAAVMIQKHFRGYIQRKYIQQAKYIIDTIKKIQRFWRKYLENKNKQIKIIEQRNNQFVKKKIEKQKQNKNQISNSLITIKDLNETSSKMNKKLSIQIEEQNYQSKKSFNSNFNISDDILAKNNLKEIIKNLLDQNGLNQAIKQKIRKAMQTEQNHKKQEAIQKQIIQNKAQYSSLNQVNKQKLQILSPIKTHKSLKSRTQLQLSLTQQQQQQFSLSKTKKDKDNYVNKKIRMQINSQKNFNSPMNSSLNNSLVSPGLKKLISPSPKCLSSSFNKDLMKSNYNNYFKSAKNVGHNLLTSPRRLSSEQKEKQKQKNIIIMKSEQKKSDTNLEQEQDQFRGNNNEQNLESQIKNLLKKKQQINNYSHHIGSLQLQGSPIIQCTDLYNIYQNENDINLLQSQKFSQLQTQRFFKQKDYIQTPVKNEKILAFPTDFYLIQEFCLIITDYLRQQQETIQIFIQKLKGLKYYKIQKIFKEWQRVKFQKYYQQDKNEEFVNLMIRQNYEYPNIFSKSQKRMIMQYPKLRLFLNQNQYQDQQMMRQGTAQNCYIKFIFDMFQQAIYENFAQYNIKNLYSAYRKQQKQNQSFFRQILSDSMGYILKTAQYLCGSFYKNDQVTEEQKLERDLINSQRQIQMTNQFKVWDYSTGQMWINMLIYKKILDEIIAQVAVDLLVKV